MFFFSLFLLTRMKNRHCPTNGDPRFDIKRPKRATGIPREFLKVVEKSAFETDEKGVMQLPGTFTLSKQPIYSFIR